jgi:hypothetical protein
MTAGRTKIGDSINGAEDVSQWEDGNRLGVVDRDWFATARVLLVLLLLLLLKMVAETG